VPADYPKRRVEVSVYCSRVGAAAPAVLLIRERVEGFFLEQLDEDGVVVGTTQHETLDEAMWYADSKYGEISEWSACPDDVDPVEYLRARFGS
jgi:hypothetical protein